MASQWETEFGMGMGMPAAFGPVAAPAYLYGRPSAAETIRVDDMLDFTQLDIYSSSSSSSSLVTADASLLNAAQFTFADINSNPECHYPHHASITDDIYMPTDEVAELEWLSKFVEDSFSDIPVQSLTAETKIPNSIHPTAISAVVRGARSKRSRGMISGPESGGFNHLPTSTWSSLTPSSSTTSSSSSSDFPTPKGCNRKKQAAVSTVAVGGGMRRCTHCASDKTPQWRTGPLGPKTLCNACGVRFKSGRLVPEYRPAASPTFVLTQHSNSHRKVLELRRQKEVLILRRHDNGGINSDYGREMMYDEYNVC